MLTPAHAPAMIDTTIGGVVMGEEDITWETFMLLWLQSTSCCRTDWAAPRPGSGEVTSATSLIPGSCWVGSTPAPSVSAWMAFSSKLTTWMKGCAITLVGHLLPFQEEGCCLAYLVQFSNTLFIPQGAIPSDGLTKTTINKNRPKCKHTGKQIIALYI